jgi:hypothetical protein
VRSNSGAGVGDELGAAAVDQVAGFGEDVLQKFEEFAEAGFLIDGFGQGLAQSGIGLDVGGGAQGAGRGLVCTWCHPKMLRPGDWKSKR